MTGPAATPATPKVAPSKPATPKVSGPGESIEVVEFIDRLNWGAAFAMLALGVVVGVGVYWLLIHVTVEDANDGR